MRYRPDIDGLRAIAVIPVVLFHAGFGAFSGGYIGVDIFFVISGYLITSILNTEIESKKFSIILFYQRRIRRIFPALIVVLIFCIMAGYAIFTPKDYIGLGQSVIAAACFVSNIYFWRQTNYFDNAVFEKPLLHTWSLSIEEQFYLFYPWLLVLVSRHSRLARSLAVVGISILSFLLSAVLVSRSQSATFYLGPTRAWELLLGGIIALGIIPELQDLRASRLAAIIGVVLIVIPIFAYTSTTRFPGIAALPPCLGAALLIWSGENQKAVIHEWLAARPAVAIGRASYSLYLWHFPIFAFARYMTVGVIGTVMAATLCLLATAVAFISVWLVERPFRFPPKDVSANRRAAVAFVAMGVMVVAGGSITRSDGFPGRISLAEKAILDVEQEQNGYYHWECLSLERKIVPPKSACRLGAQNVEPTMLLWGDSHAVVTASALEQAAIKNGVAFLFAASVDCPIGIGFGIDAHTGPSFVSSPGYQYCEQYNKNMLALALAAPKIRTIILSSRWSNWRVGENGSPAESPVDIRLRNAAGTAQSMVDNRRIFAVGLENLVSALTAAGKVLWIVGPVPQPSVRVPQALYVKRIGIDDADIDVPRDTFSAQNRFIVDLFGKMSKQYPLHFIWPDQALCGSTTCPVTENNKPLFFDTNHLSKYGVAKITPLFNAIFQDHRNPVPNY
jgi:peptidoglycan/LPS O-acetylase OafA/YrhL